MFFLNTNGYGIYLNSSYYSKFRLATERTDMYSFTADTGGSADSLLDYYFLHGDDLKDVVSNYTDITAKPSALPKWAFGLWMSANEWDRQSEVLAAVDNATIHDIPATATVLEQWSDENTFYIFNDAQYTPVAGGSTLTYNDFTFGGKWPDPKGMVSNIHQNGIKVLMWTAYSDLNALKAASGEGWSTGKDHYGEVTYVKVAAAASSSKTIEVTGSASVSSASLIYEAEEASLSGNTVNTKAGVNTNHAGYSGAGFVDGFHNEGAAATFYVDVKSGGDYEVDLRYANATGSVKTVGIYINGERIKQTALANHASWSTWATQRETLPLQAGRNTVTYKYDGHAGDTGNVNLDYIQVPFAPAIFKVEAESGRLSGGASTNQNHWFYTGYGFVEGLTTAGAEIELKVDVPAAGNYEASLRYANGTMNAKTISTYVNGSKAGQISLPSPGGNWNEWQDHVQTLSLQAGTNTIAFKYDAADSGNVNLDSLLLSAAAPGIPQSELNLLDNPGFERASGLNSNWTQWHPTGQPSAFGIDSGSGINPPESPKTGDQRAFFHLADSYQQSIHQLIEVPQNNAHYKFEAWVRLINTMPATARAEISNHGASAIHHDIVKIDGWKRITIDNIYVTSGQLDVGFYVDSPGGTTLHIDDVRITRQ